MGINTLERLQLLEYWIDESNMKFENINMCELGNQRIWKTLNISGIPLNNNAYLLKDYYEVLKKIKSHISIDFNGKDGALKLDLRKQIDVSDIGGPFDVVTNFGTTEHVEDNQYQTFKNIHDLCKVGGIMYHVVPKENNWDGARAGLNHPHCPYYYTSEFFSELAESNGYEMVVNKVWNHDEAKPQRAREECVCVFKKVNNNEFIKLDNFPESMLRRI